jgi:hypothetical protein
MTFLFSHTSLEYSTNSPNMRQFLTTTGKLPQLSNSHNKDKLLQTTRSVKLAFHCLSIEIVAYHYNSKRDSRRQKYVQYIFSKEQF